jgi:outer membrane protein assembly factor BamB
VTYAVRPGGKGDVTESHTAWTLDKRAPNTPSMLVKDDELYTVADNGVVSCIDAKTGKVNWYERTGRACSASPILFNDRIYVLDEFGTTTVVRADKSGYTELAKNKLDDEATLASITPDEGALYIRTAERLYCIREK